MDGELYIGVMSGTSLDGVDTALVQINGATTTLLHHDYYPISETLKQRLLTISHNQSTNTFFNHYCLPSLL